MCNEMAIERQTPRQRALIDLVKARMKSQGLTYRQAALQVGCSAANLSRILSGKIGMSAEIERRLVRSFPIDEVPVESVVGIVRGLGQIELRLALQFLQILQQLQRAEE